MKGKTDILTTVLRFGKLNYSAERICILLMLDRKQKAEFMDLFNNPDSEVRRTYDKGLAMGEMKTDIYVNREAKNGNVLAIIEQSKRAYYKEMNELKDKLFP